MTMRFRRKTLIFALLLATTDLATGCGAAGPTHDLTLRRVVLYRNGVGYFERSGTIEHDSLSLQFASRELDDVLGTLTVQERGEAERTVVSASVPARREGEGQGDTVAVELALPDARARDLILTYALPAPAWRAAYRVVLPDNNETGEALFQIWAMVQNESAEDWNDVQLTLATTAPFSFQYDLRTPSFVQRPTVGALGGNAGPTGVIVASESRASGEASALDSFRLALAAPTNQAIPVYAGDRDGDAIMDADDSCPNDVETYNGSEDDDGCPDRGRVLLTSNEVVVLDRVYFADGSDEMAANSRPVVDAVAATMIGNAQIASLEIRGYAASNERDPWGISAARAGSIRAALLERGVAANRVIAVPFGATQPLDAHNTAAAHEQNRRVQFEIVRSGAEAERGQPATHSPDAPRTRVSDGATEYSVGAAVSIRAHSSSMVTVLSERVHGESVLLYRPERDAPRSDVHPYRAARLATPERATLIPGPVAVYAGGTFVGQGVVEHLHEGQTALLPYAMDETTDVQVQRDPATEPVRILTAARGVLTVEDRTVFRTVYTIDAGPHAPQRIVLEHVRRPATTPRGMPPEADVRDDRVVFEIPLATGTRSSVTIEETTPTRRLITLSADLGVNITPYLEVSGLSPELANQVRAIVVCRERLAESAEQRSMFREQLSDATTRAAELRADLRVIHSPDLRRSLELRLREASTQTENLSQQLSALTVRETERRSELAELVRALRIDEPVVAPR